MLLTYYIHNHQSTRTAPRFIGPGLTHGWLHFVLCPPNCNNMTPTLLCLRRRTICDIYTDKLYDPDLQQAGKMCLLNQGNLLTLVAEWLVRPPGSTLAWGTKKKKNNNNRATSSHRSHTKTT
ncbi:predicted protein [Histoplasma capsulatum var. duboisii H88]|uniref:Predicted protein n=1 Tax=Ajellomyces capsulatus (strain H88) TaxID=544711 RepID=F0UW71_AJEC8|nr:predicted protein [Histoplasma capsulatum var. duboisii H88]